MARTTKTPHATAQQRYREMLRQQGVPEVGHADTALAAAIYAAFRQQGLLANPSSRKALLTTLRMASRFLCAQGFDAEASKQVLRRRVGITNPRFEALCFQLAAAPANQGTD